ncbi:hypothetical protein EDD16DRAFT_1527638 [Pisolithus croceorrhizus]|nr:hypothetical protein EDD16DRAFT_1527638 [Pisolithus croceorrhizus]KAI6103282.1 hypothetical protein EV401DRAFT_1893658 [Pisolithus croceorrhizus]
MAQSKLQEQLSLRAGKPPERNYVEVLNGMVKMPDKVKNVNRKAEDDLPLKPCDGSTMNDMPSAHALLLKGEQAACMSSIISGSGTTDGQSCYAKEPCLTIYDAGGTLEQLMAHNQVAKNEDRPSSPVKHADQVNGCMKQCVPNAYRVLLEGEKTRCMSRHNEINLQGQEETTASSTESTMPWG